MRQIALLALLLALSGCGLNRAAGVLPARLDDLARERDASGTPGPR